jgi:hypothetical protein
MKSFSTAVVLCEERVSSRKLVKHTGVCSRLVMSAPPVKKAGAGMVEGVALLAVG